MPRKGRSFRFFNFPAHISVSGPDSSRGEVIQHAATFAVQMDQAHDNGVERHSDTVCQWFYTGPYISSWQVTGLPRSK